MDTTPTKEKEIVIASYREDLNWVLDLPNSWHVSIYNTLGTPREFPPRGVVTANLPNYGREASQWLTHIVRNYNNLAEFTLFVQADRKHLPNKIDEILLADQPPSDNFRYVGAPPDDPHGPPPFLFPQTERLLKAGWQNTPIPCTALFQVGAQFYARKAVILNRPVDHYQRLLDATLNPNPEWSPAHLLEPVWGCVFDRVIKKPKAATHEPATASAGTAQP